MGQGRVELPTSRLSGVRSNHLSYWPSQVTARAALDSRPEGTCARLALAVSGVAANRIGCGPRSLETEPYALLELARQWVLTSRPCSGAPTPFGEGALESEDSLERR